MQKVSYCTRLRSRKKIPIAAIVAIILGTNGVAESNAQEIFRNENEGSPFYTTSKPNPDAKPVELPEIEKTSLPPITSSPATCRSHGGVKCKEGADIDGSVICIDGFKDSQQDFGSTCSEAKLVIETIKRDNASRTAKVFVRSVNPVDADDPFISYRDIEMKRHKLNGPVILEAYGMMEFTLENLGVDPEKTAIEIGCTNCP